MSRGTRARRKTIYRPKRKIPINIRPRCECCRIRPTAGTGTYCVICATALDNYRDHAAHGAYALS